MSQDDNAEPESNVNDFVIRDGFPALRNPGDGGKQSSSPWMLNGTEPLPRHLFWAHPEAFHIDPSSQVTTSLWKDCCTVFSARARDDDQAYSAGVTYFCPSQMKPRCALEALALSIFRKHTQDLEEGVMIPEQSGAEWWTLVLDDEDEEQEQETTKNGASDEEEDDQGDEVGLHFDADYGLEDQAPNLLLHPRLATVTYLTDYGAPTVVFDKRSPPPDDPDKQTLQGSIRKGWLSHPKIGKHIAFDGRLLHGAPNTFFPANIKSSSSSSSSRKAQTNSNTNEPPTKRAKQDRDHPHHQKRRITLLVNVWVNHCPLDAELLDDDVCDQLETPMQQNNNGDSNEITRPAFVWNDNVDLGKSAECRKVSLSPSKSDPAGEEEFVLCSHLVTAKYGASMADLHQATREGELMELDLDEGVLSLEVGGEVQSDDDKEDDND